MNRKLILLSAIGALCILSGAAVLSSSDDSDAANYSYEWAIDVAVDTQIGMSNSPTSVSLQSGSLPPGISIVKGESSGVGYNWYFRGTPSSSGVYDFSLMTVAPGHQTLYPSYQIWVNNPPLVYVDVTYYGNGGLIKGLSAYVEKVVYGTNANLNYVPVMSDGSNTFRGWGTSVSSGVITSLTPTSNASLYALWTQNSASVSSWSATVPHMQSFSNTFTTNPSSASISISSAPSGWGVSVSGKTLSGSVPDAVAPGNYYVVLQTSASGWKTTTSTVTITVPVYIVPPIEKTQTVGTTFSWEPVTNPNNAAITVTGVRFNDSLLSNSGFSLSGRTITGPLSNVGTYEVTYTASASGYTSSNGVVRISVTPVPEIYNPPSIGSILVTPRADEPRTVDFTAVNVSNYATISWSTLGSVFQTASLTAVFEYPASGVYTIRCTLTGFAADTVYAEASLVVIDTYYPELAWVGVPWSVVVSGSPSVDVSSVPWLTSAPQTVGSSTYTVISGTPEQSHSGNEYTYSIGGTPKIVTVYDIQSVAPVASFDFALSGDGFTATVTWTGSNASVVYYDYGDGSPKTASATHTYATAGSWILTATAVNNIGERISSAVVFTAGYDEPVPSTRVLDLTDITKKKGERVWVPLTLEEGESVTLLGEATAFLTYVDGVIVGETVDVDIGTYGLTVTLTPVEDIPDIQKTISVIIISPEDGGDGDGDGGLPNYLVYIAILIVVLAVIGYAAVKSAGGKKRK
jgi:hypothetical protein